MYLVISLTVADMLVGVLSAGYDQFLLLWKCSLMKLNLSGKVRVLLSGIPFFLPFVSLTDIAVISVERFHATFRPFRHRFIKSWAHVVAIAVVWVFPLIVSAILGVELLYLIGYHLYIL